MSIFDDNPIPNDRFVEHFCICGNPLLSNSEKINDMCYTCMGHNDRHEGDPVELDFS